MVVLQQHDVRHRSFETFDVKTLISFLAMIYKIGCFWVRIIAFVICPKVQRSSGAKKSATTFVGHLLTFYTFSKKHDSRRL